MAGPVSPRPGIEPALMRVWARRGPFALLLWPLSVLYGFAVLLRRLAYRLGLIKSHRASAPVLVVGNVVAGGAGKTPVVMALAAHLKARGVNTGVVSRGYGRITQDCREVLADSNARDVGDEPLLIKRTAGVPVFVAVKRHEAAAALLASYPQTQLLICDDGLQHYALQRDLEICVFDQRGVSNGFLLPAGPLREPWPRRLNFMLQAGGAPALAGTYPLKRQLSGQAERADGTKFPLKDLAGEPLVAVAAIAQPDLFFDMLRQEGLTLAHALALSDHYDFSSWSRPYFGTGRLICTQKDAVKLWAGHPDALAAPLSLAFDPRFLQDFDRAIDALLRQAAR